MSIKFKYKIQIKSLTLIVLLFFAFRSIEAQQSVTLSGKIIEESTSKAIPGATIVVKGSQTGVLSDGNGGFSL